MGTYVLHRILTPISGYSGNLFREVYLIDFEDSLVYVDTPPSTLPSRRMASRPITMGGRLQSAGNNKLANQLRLL